MNTEVVNDFVHIKLEGNMYVEESIILRETIIKSIEEGYKNFCFDLQSLNYIDSAGLGVLVGCKKRVAQTNGKVILKNLNGTVKEIIELTRLNLIFDGN
ncbi:STAS domain-containing protein [Bacillus mesophilus]|uniref:Anti-sigma factor antagonist n=1 Tax=Bacillus mesophilus TaxID=1808955 RepID=A0A6M0QEP2_9BACI|nr:STAS domain-containing protein [Bacillus mesophilus]NEY73788.1 STAS domain-containing protein [Bacillus mesophilus]